MAESAQPWQPPSARIKYAKLMRPISWNGFYICADRFVHIYRLAERCVDIREEPWGSKTSGDSRAASLAPKDAEMGIWQREWDLRSHRSSYHLEGLLRFAGCLSDVPSPSDDAAEEVDVAQLIAHHLEVAALTPGNFMNGFTRAIELYERELNSGNIVSTSEDARWKRMEAQGLAGGLEEGLVLFGQIAVVEACRKAAGMSPRNLPDKPKSST